MRIAAGHARTSLALLAACAAGAAANSTTAGAAAAPSPAASATAASGAAAARAAPGARTAPPAVEPLAILQRGHRAFARPSDRSAHLIYLHSVRPITGARTVLPVLGERTGENGREWLHVMLPGRPNGATGWISPRFTRYALTIWRVDVDLSARRVTVLRRGRVLRTFSGVVGAPATPTPRGRFFVEETVRLGEDLVGAPYALALSARSDVLDQFAGGPGQIALHGRGNIGGTLGTAASHGCVRLDDRAIRWLAARLGPGTPVTIGR